MQTKQKGFTLIEIAIVLVIIGLLLGGVLKGQELIDSAKVKNLVSDFRNIPVFIYGYQDRFRALPGDDAAAATHLAGAGSCTPAATGLCTTGNGLIDGAWDAANDATSESNLFWQHVRLAGYVSGSTTVGDAAYPQTNAIGGHIGIQSNNAGFTTITADSTSSASTMKGSFVICSAGIPGKYATQIDTNLDDGDTDTGAVRVADPASAGQSIATASIAEGSAYTVCMGI